MALFEAYEVFIGVVVYAALVSLFIYFCIKYQKPQNNEDNEPDPENDPEKQVKICYCTFYQDCIERCEIC